MALWLAPPATATDSDADLDHPDDYGYVCGAGGFKVGDTVTTGDGTRWACRATSINGEYITYWEPISGPAAESWNPTANALIDYAGHGDWATVSGYVTAPTAPGRLWSYRVVAYNADNRNDVIYDHTAYCSEYATTCRVPTETVFVNSAFQTYNVQGYVFVGSTMVRTSAVYSVPTSYC